MAAWSDFRTESPRRGGTGQQIGTCSESRCLRASVRNQQWRFLPIGLLQREPRQLDNLATLLCRLVGAQANARPVRAGTRVGPWVALLDEGRHELIDQVRMRAAVASALDERKVLGVVNLRRLREFSNGLWQQISIIRHGHLFGDFRLGLFGSVDDVRLVLGERPLKALLGAVDVEALAVLPGHVIQESPNMCTYIRLSQLDVAAFD